MSDPSASNRRERNKQRTRQRLHQAALELFAEKGYAATSVAEIAEAADVAPRTFFRYFDSKEDLLLPDVKAFFHNIMRAVEARPIEEHPLVSVREAVRAVTEADATIAALPPYPQPLGDGHAAAPPAPLIRAFLGWEEDLAAHFYQRFKSQATMEQVPDHALRHHAAVVALTAVAAVRSASRSYRASRDARSTTDADIAHLLDQAFAIVAAGCPPPSGSV